MEHIYIPQFVSQKEDTRNKLREIFLIPKSSHAEVITDHMGVGIVVCDGTTNVDLQNLTVEKMRDYLGTAAIDDSINTLFTQVVAKIEGLCTECVKTIETSTLEPSVAEPVVSIAEVLPQNDIKVDSKVEGEVIKCSKCAFETKSNFAMRMHVGRKHK